MLKYQTKNNNNEIQMIPLSEVEAKDEFLDFVKQEPK